MRAKRTFNRSHLRLHKRPLAIPANVPFEDIVKAKINNKQVNRDCILYLLNLIYRKSLVFTKDMPNEYIQLKASYLNRFHYLASTYLRYLVDIGVLECDYVYNVGVKALGYRFKKKYISCSDEAFYKFSYCRSYRKINNISYAEPQTRCKDLNISYLLKPFERKAISIDKEGAIGQLVDIYQKKHQDIIKNSYSKASISSIWRTYDIQKSRVTKISNSDYLDSVMIDDTSFRFHSLFTSLKKELRSFIRINKEPLAEIDLKNSQPFFSLLLFEPRENRRKVKKLIKEVSRRYKTRNKDNINKYSEYIYKCIAHMIWKTAKSQSGIDFEISEYREKILAGEIYDCFISNNLVGEDREKARKKVKQSFLIFMYDANRKCLEHGFKNVVKGRFPFIYEYFRQLKNFETGQKTRVKSIRLVKYGADYKRGFIEVDEGFRNISRFIQRLESYVFLCSACKRLYEVYPDFPFITIHDSILCPQSIKEQVYSIISDTIEEVMGYKPKLSIKLL